jgi:tetratricopeptide (TPR) repeat protein
VCCISEHTLLKLFSGKLSDERRVELEHHLDGCAPCRRLTVEGARQFVSSQHPSAPPAQGLLLAPGTQLGRYELIAPLDAGAMGLVYTARDPLLDRTVALKLLWAMENAAPGRLLREAQALARLSHPNIVNVYDAGVASGHVYLAMELIEGATLTEWLRARQRSPREILEVFAQAGRGLAAAHQAQVVHGDFKPDNVLVAQTGRVCLTDFGLASSPRLAAERHLLTAPVGTPAFMAPELFEGATPTETTDQFAFCVALYEALTRQRPFPGATLDELREQVLMGAVREPPIRLPARLHRALMRGLSRRPEERHPSMASLLSALTPRRRPAAVWSALASALAAVVLVLQPWRPGPCEGGPERVASVWNAAAQERLRQAFDATEQAFAATTYRAVVAALNEYASAWTTARTEACRAALATPEELERRWPQQSQCFDERLLQLDALVQVLAAGDAKSLARAAAAAGDLPRVQGCVLQGAPREVSRPASLAVAAKAARVRVLAQSGQNAAAKALALDVLKETDDPLWTSRIQLELAVTMLWLSEYEAAHATLLQAASLAHAAQDGFTQARALSMLVYTLSEGLGRQRDAEQMSILAEGAVRSLNDEVTTASYHQTLAGLRLRQEKLEEALRLMQDALQRFQSALGPRHLRVATVAGLVATTASRLGRDAEALEASSLALSLSMELLGPEHPTTLTARVNKGFVLSGVNDTEAEEVLAAALPGIKRTLGDDSTSRAACEHNLADIRMRAGRCEEALAGYRTALGVYEKAHGPQHQFLIQPLLSMSYCLRQLGRLDQAGRMIARAQSVMRGLQSPPPRLTNRLEVERGLLLLATARYVEAERVLERASRGGDDGALMALALFHLERGNARSARAALEQALPRRTSPYARAYALFLLARAQHELGERARARALAEEAQGLYRAAGLSGTRYAEEIAEWLRGRS